MNMSFFDFYTKVALRAFVEGISKTTGTLFVVAIGYKLYFKRQILDIKENQHDTTTTGNRLNHKIRLN